MRLQRTVVAGVVLGSLTAPAYGQDAAAQPGETLDKPEASAALIQPDPLAPVTDAVQALRDATNEHANLDFELGYTLIFQITDNASVVEPTNALWTGSYDFAGFWAAIPQDTGYGVGGLGWLVEGGHNIGHHRTEDFSANVGSTLGLNDDADPTTAIAITELWWQHALGPVTAGEGDQAVQLLTLTAGKIDQSAFFDGNRVANDETAQFLATPLVNSVAIAFPDNGLGVNAWLQVCEVLYATAGFGDANAVATHSPDSFESDELFWAGEVGFTPTIDGLGEGAYRLMVWHTRMDDGAGGAVDGSGFSISIDQEVLPGIVPFARYSHGDDDVLDFETTVSAGVGFEGPFGRRDDLFAVGYAWADPADAAADDQSLVEAFYRLQLTDSVHVTPAVQAVFDPADNPDEDTVIVGAIRTQFTF